MVGYLLALAGLKPDGRPYLHSHQLAVLPEFRRQGVGKLLKWRQRQEARDRGIELVEWTFDPLEINNAWLNINRLGAVVRQFRPNFYGKTSSRLHGALPTDRCIAEWWVASDRVERALAGQIPMPRVEAAVAVPSRAVGVGAPDSAAASRIQQRVREEFLLLLGRGLTVTGFQRTEQGGMYLFSRFEKAPAASAAAREVLAPCS
jgi:predicted GNAT superfamily acetyltransferase